MFSIEDVLDMAIKIEENGERYYRQALEKVSDPSLTAMLWCLAEEEVHHRNLFRKWRRDYQAADDERWIRDMSGSMLKDLVGDQTFSLKEVDPGQLHTETEILQAAIEFEGDTILFFEMVRDFVADDQTRQRIDELIAEEKRHRRILVDCLRSRKSVCSSQRQVQAVPAERL